MDTYYAAGIYPTKEQSTANYQALQEIIKTSKSKDCSIYRITVDKDKPDGKTVIVLIGVYIDATLQKAVTTYFSDKNIELSKQTIEQLWVRRGYQEQYGNIDATPIPNKPGRSFIESHTPTLIDAHGRESDTLTSLDSDETITATLTNKQGKEWTVDIHKNAFLAGKEDHLFRGTLTPDGIADRWSVWDSMVQLHNFKQNKPFTATAVPSPTGITSPFPVGSKLTVQTIPFIKGYEAIEAGLVTSEMRRDYYKKFGNTPLPTDVHQIINHVVKAGSTHLHIANKYRFTPSALAMLRVVADLSNKEWVEPGSSNIWIEFETPINTPYGDNIKALYLTYENLIHQITGKATRDDYRIPHGVSGTYTYWHLLIISTRCEWIFRYAYRLPEQLWAYNDTHICPYNCVHPQPGYLIDHNVVDTINTPKCIEARNYWLSCLRTALKMIAGEYATSPNPEQFQIEPLSYVSEEMVTVGKGKNKRRVNKTVTRHVDYRVVSYDISTTKPLLPEHEQAIEHSGEKRLNWLVTADRASIIWEKRKIPAYQRRYPTRKNGTRQSGLVQIKEPFYKWVPMLTPGYKTIKRLTATKYESEHQP
jgi:hypothetical protein